MGVAIAILICFNGRGNAETSLTLITGLKMKPSEVERRHQLLKTYFEGRDWDVVGEYSLKRQLVLNSAQLLPNYPFVIDDEWEVEPGRSDQGRGDLIFTDGHGNFAVVEVKYLDLPSQDSPASNRRSKKRRESNREKRRQVEAQAPKYAKRLQEKLRITEPVAAYYFTNDHEKPQQLETPIVQPLD